jgi:hypothetical protein
MEKQGLDDAEQLLTQLTAFIIDMSFFCYLPCSGRQRDVKDPVFTALFIFVYSSAFSVGQKLEEKILCF